MAYEAWCDLVPSNFPISSLPTLPSPFSMLVTMVSSVFWGLTRHTPVEGPSYLLSPLTKMLLSQRAEWLAPSPHFSENFNVTFQVRPFLCLSKTAAALPLYYIHTLLIPFLALFFFLSLPIT